jgi:hypothetical protein
MLRSRLAPLALALLLVPSVARARPCPNIMLVLDQSASMAMDPNGGSTHPSKWELLQQVVTDVVRTYGDHVPFGLELFTSMARGDAAQCLADAKITVELSHASAPAIFTALANASPLSETNTGEAIEVAAMDPALADTTKPDYIILVTDGDPNCNPDDLTSAATGMPPSFTIGQIQAAHDRSPSIRTYVVGFDGSGGVNPSNLDQMAFAGGTTVPGCMGSAFGTPCYYSASSAQAFKDAIDKIVTDVGGEFGGGICDDSCYTIPCPAGQVCLTSEQNPSPHCENDPCAGASCGGGQFCRLGKCVDACGSCAATQTCQNGRCVPDLCSGKKCDSGLLCDPSSGTCVTSPCAACTSGNLCDFSTGSCVADQCRIIACPKGTTCVNNGNCVGHGGGCDAGPARRAAAPVELVGGAALLGLLLARGRRRERRRRAM